MPSSLVQKKTEGYTRNQAHWLLTQGGWKRDGNNGRMGKRRQWVRVTLLSTPFCLVLTFRTRLPAHSLSCASNSKESPCFAFDLWVGKIPWRTTWQPTPVFLPGEFHGQRSLAGYSAWGCKELDTTEQLTQAHTTSNHRVCYGITWEPPLKKMLWLNILRDWSYCSSVLGESWWHSSSKSPKSTLNHT